MNERTKQMGQALRVIGEAVPEHSPLSLELPEDLGFEAWVDVGRRLCIGQQAINWHIGDWWAFGDHRYGERAKAAAEGIFGREFQTLANLASVSRTFEPSRRREVLPFSHHAEVAGLANSNPGLAETLLDRAAEEHLSKAALRREVQALRVANDSGSQVRSVDQSRAKPQPFAKHELAEAYSRYVEAMEQLEAFRPLTRREADYLTVALDYLGEAHAERRPVPDDFDIVFVEKGRLSCETHYGASRITVNRWLGQRGKKRLIDERALFVKFERAKARGDEPKTAAEAAAPPVDTFLPIAKMAADHIRQSRYGRWPVSRAQDGHGWFVGSARRTSEELIAMAQRQGFDVEAAKLEAKQEGY